MLESMLCARSLCCRKPARRLRRLPRRRSRVSATTQQGGAGPPQASSLHPPPLLLPPPSLPEAAVFSPRSLTSNDVRWGCDFLQSSWPTSCSSRPAERQYTQGSAAQQAPHNRSRDRDRSNIQETERSYSETISLPMPHRCRIDAAVEAIADLGVRAGLCAFPSFSDHSPCALCVAVTVSL